MFTQHQVSCVKCHVSPLTCQVSHFMCDLSRVTCHMYFFLFKTCFLLFFFFFFFFFFYNAQSGGASWWRVCYQRGFPCLVLTTSICINLSQSSLFLIFVASQSSSQSAFHHRKEGFMTVSTVSSNLDSYYNLILLWWHIGYPIPVGEICWQSVTLIQWCSKCVPIVCWWESTAFYNTLLDCTVLVQALGLGEDI